MAGSFFGHSKRSFANFSGAESAAKRRRMDSIDRAQQAEIDELQALFRPELKYKAIQDTSDHRPNIFGTAGVSGTARTGPVYFFPWDSIAVGTGPHERLGHKLLCIDYSLELAVRWNAYYEESGNVFPIATQGLRIDAFWYKNCRDDSTIFMPDFWRIKGMSRLGTTGGADVYAKHQYVYGKGYNLPDLQSLKGLSYAKTWFIKPPAVCTHKVPNKQVELHDMTVMVNDTAGSLTAGTGAIATVSTQVNMANKQYTDIDEKSHTATVEHYKFSFPLPKRGFKVEYGLNDDGTDQGHIKNDNFPIFLISWYGERSDNNGDSTHISSNTNVGQCLIENCVQWMRYRDV